MEKNNNEYVILDIKKPKSPKMVGNMTNQLETILKVFRFGRLGIILLSLIICLQMSNNLSFKGKLAIILLKIIQVIFFQVLGVKIKSSKKALEILETICYKTKDTYDDSLNIQEVISNKEKKLGV